MIAAIIDYKEGISKLDQTLFLKKTLKNCKTEIKENEITIKKYYIPIHIEKPSEKALQKFCDFLKRENVFYIYLTHRAKQIECVKEILSKNFSFFTGQQVINYKTCDIIRKYAGKNEKKLSESSILLETNDPQKAEDVINQICRRVKKISIKTNQEERFSPLCEFFLKEYGLFISFNDTENYDIYVELDAKPAPSFYLNISADEKNANRIMFKLQNKKEHDQFYIEFLIYCQYGALNKKTIKEFFNRHSVRISKIL